MNIVLVGFMGTGKSVVGRRVAHRLRVPFIDVDHVMEKESKLAVRDLFATRGEDAFRQLERETIAAVAARDRVVISTGGGALLNPENKSALSHHGLLVCLTATLATLMDRLKDDGTRPLLAGDHLPQRLERLMSERERLYAECPIHVATDHKSADQVAGEVIEKTAPQWKAA